MNFKFENWLKGLVTTLLGLGLMVGAAYEWWIDYFTDWQAIAAGSIGFMLVYARTKIDDLIQEAIKKLIEKFTK